MHMVQVQQGTSRNTSAPAIHREQMYMVQAKNIGSPKVSATSDDDTDVNMIQKGGMTTREMKKFTREVNLAEANMGLLPEYLDWSTQSIPFSRADHPP